MAVESRRALRRQAVRDRLLVWDLAGLEGVYRGDPGVLSTLVGFLSELDDRLRWRALHGVGRLAGLRARESLEAVRELVRRQFWAMNDESGNVAWHAPEAIAEVLFRVPVICPEFAAQLFRHVEEDLFRNGVVWGMARLAANCPEVVMPEWPALLQALSDPTAAVRGLAALAVGRLQAGLTAEQRRQGEELLAALGDDQRELAIFDERDGELHALTVAALAAGPAA